MTGASIEQRLCSAARAVPALRRLAQRLFKSDDAADQRAAATLTVLTQTGARPGNAAYTRAHGTRGITTLTFRHVRCVGDDVRLDYTGKKGVRQQFALRSRPLAAWIRRCRASRLCDGPFLSSWQLAQLLGKHNTRAKDIRTWRANEAFVRAKNRGKGDDDAVAIVAEAIGNTAGVCKRSYISPKLLGLGARRGAYALPCGR